MFSLTHHLVSILLVFLGLTEADVDTDPGAGSIASASKGQIEPTG